MSTLPPIKFNVKDQSATSELIQQALINAGHISGRAKCLDFPYMYFMGSTIYFGMNIDSFNEDLSIELTYYELLDKLKGYSSEVAVEEIEETEKEREIRFFFGDSSVWWER